MQVGWKRTLFVLAIALLNIGCDQISKSIAKEQLPPGKEYSYLGDTFRLVYVENTGAFLSLGANLSDNARSLALKVFPLLLLTGLFIYLLRSKELNQWSIIAFSFILGGGISNIYDRLLYGGVIDFMNMGIGSLRTGIFNFADVSIMIGLFMMIPYMFKKKEEPEVSESKVE